MPIACWGWCPTLSFLDQDSILRMVYLISILLVSYSVFFEPSISIPGRSLVLGLYYFGQARGIVLITSKVFPWFYNFFYFYFCVLFLF